MTAANRVVLQAEHRMQMQTRAAVIALRDVADQVQHLALLVNLNRLVFPGGEIEPAYFCLRECSDRRYRSAGDRDRQTQ